MPVRKSSDSSGLGSTVSQGHLAQPHCPALPPDLVLYCEAFLTTYRTFISPEELIKKLQHRYPFLAPVPPGRAVGTGSASSGQASSLSSALCGRAEGGVKGLGRWF